MTDLFSLLEPEETPKAAPRLEPRLITDSQRTALRKAFAELGLTTAVEQFALVEELTGKSIASVTQMTEDHARTLLHRIINKVQTVGRPNTGNAWDDREEDTWIDKL